MAEEVESVGAQATPDGASETPQAGQPSAANAVKGGCGLVLLILGIVIVFGAVFGGPSLERTAERMAEEEWRRGESEGAPWVQLITSPEATFPVRRDLASLRASMVLIETDERQHSKYEAEDRDELHLLVTKRLLEIAEQGGL